MQIQANELRTLVFQRAVVQDMAAFSVDSQMLQILLEVDGVRTGSEVAQSLALDIPAVLPVFDRLAQLKLIERVEMAVPVLEATFIDDMEDELSLAIGPIAGVLVEETALVLGHEITQFPRQKAPELVDRVAAEIQNEDRQLQFKTKMVEALRSLV